MLVSIYLDLYVEDRRSTDDYSTIDVYCMARIFGDGFT
jgi:hypothetical protein